MNESIQNSIQQLSPEQQLEVAHFIYESLVSSGRLLSDAQLEETRKRAKQIEDEPNTLLSANEMWNQVDELRDARKD